MNTTVQSVDPASSAAPSLRAYRVVWAVLALIATYVALRLAVPHIVFRSILWSTIIATILFMVLSLVMVVKATQIPTSIAAEVILLALLVSLFVLLHYLRGYVADILCETALMLSAVPLGKLTSRLVRHPNLILPVAVVAALVDTWGVNLGGPVSQIAARAPTLLDSLTAKIPHFSDGAPGAARVVAVIGVGDFAFLALFFTCLIRFRMDIHLSPWCAVAAMCIGMLVVTVLPFNTAIPGLPFLVIGILLPNLKYFHFTRAEKFAMLYAGLALVAVLAGVYGMVQMFLPQPCPASVHLP